MSYPIGKHEENEKLKRENAELKAMVNVLRDEFNSPSADYDSIEAVLAKTPAQSLEDYGMRVAEAVREACSNRSFDAEITYRIHGIDLTPIVKGVK